VFQDPEHQIVTSSVRDELRVGPLRAGRPEAQVDARADELLERLGLTALAAANPYTLSGGEKRRLSVATAIATSPRVVVADEPTYGQDSRTWAELVALLAELRDSGWPLLVTHDEDLVTSLADDKLGPRGRATAAAERGAAVSVLTPLLVDRSAGWAGSTGRQGQRGRDRAGRAAHAGPVDADAAAAAELAVAR
jgi:ABC-type dipeptide/oligopeptide/nickel transport system ATPase subunit